MAEKPRPHRRGRQPADERNPLTEEDVAMMHEQGVLSRVIRLPFVMGAPPAHLNLLPLSVMHLVPTAPPAAAVVEIPALSAPRQMPLDLWLADGSRARVTSAGLVVGRRRVGEAATGTSSTPRLELDDASRSSSREHVRLTAGEGGTVHVMDLGSANGTSVQRPNGQKIDFVPGTPVGLGVGDVLHLGDNPAFLREAVHW